MFQKIDLNSAVDYGVLIHSTLSNAVGALTQQDVNEMFDRIITKNTINGSEINSVNARETYEYLGLAKGQFSRWIKSAIDKAKKKGAAFVAKAVGKMSGKVATLLSGVASAIPLAMIAS
jgi:hypothetical protein